MSELLLLNNGSVLWAQTIWQASVGGALAIVLLWASRYAWPQMSPVLRCWLWRALFGKLLLGLFWSASVALPVLPTPVQQAPLEYAATAEVDSPMESPSRHVPLAEMTQRENSSNSLSLSSIALLFWLAGIAGLVGRGLKAWRTTRQWRDDGQPLRDPHLDAILEDIRSRFALPRAPELRICPAISSPALIGVHRPVILLPLGFSSDHKSQPAAVKFMLAHELAHHKRRDLSWNWLLWLAQTLFWFHPLVWLAAREWRMAQEVACDELAVRVTQAPVADYGAMLLQTAVTGHSKANLFAAGISENYANLRWRLVAMKHFSPKKPTWRSGAVCLLLAAFILVPWALTSRPPVPAGPQKLQPMAGVTAKPKPVMRKAHVVPEIIHEIITKQEFQKLQQEAGVIVMNGPGVVIDISDRPYPLKASPSAPVNMGVGLVHDYDILALVNELRAAGAEGIAVNGIRVGNSTAIRCVGPTIFVGQQPIAPPFRIEAISNSPWMHKFLTKRGSFFDGLKNGAPYSPNVKVVRAPQLRLPAISRTHNVRFTKST